MPSIINSEILYEIQLRILHQKVCYHIIVTIGITYFIALGGIVDYCYHPYNLWNS